MAPVAIPGPGFTPTADMVNHPDPTIRASQVANLAQWLRWAQGVLDQWITDSTTGAGAPADAPYLTVFGDGRLTKERKLVATLPIVLTDSGANSVMTVSVNDATTLAVGVLKLAHHLGGTAVLPDVIGLKETGGPTSLLYAAVADGQFLKRSGSTVIGAALGTGATATFYDNETPGGSVTGTDGTDGNATFTLAASPNPTGSLMLFVNDALQYKTDDYTLSGATITFVSGKIPISPSLLRAWYRGV